MTFPHHEVEKYLSDIVISTVRMALKCPSGPVDLEVAIPARILGKMKVQLDSVGPAAEWGLRCIQCQQPIPGNQPKHYEHPRSGMSPCCENCFNKNKESCLT